MAKVEKVNFPAPKAGENKKAVMEAEVSVEDAGFSVDSKAVLEGLRKSNPPVARSLEKILSTREQNKKDPEKRQKRLDLD